MPFQINIGHLNFTDFELGFVAAPGQTWEPTTEPPLDAGEIAAIVICALAASVIVLVVILFLHKKRRAAEKERQLMVERINSIKFERKYLNRFVTDNFGEIKK